jgi:hypothetical protein
MNRIIHGKLLFAQFNVHHAKIFLNFHENYLKKIVYFQVSSPQKVQVSLRANPKQTNKQILYYPQTLYSVQNIKQIHRNQRQ